MKTKNLLIGFFSVCMFIQIIQAQTNVYHPFLNDTTVEWTTSINSYIVKYNISGKIKIKNKWYYVLRETYCIPSGTVSCSVVGIDTVAYLREDVVNKKVYGYIYIPIGNFFDYLSHMDTTQNEILIYDFDSLYVGKHLNENIAKGDIIGCVDSTQLLDGTFRKYFTLYPSYPGPPPGNGCANLNNVFVGFNPPTIIEEIGSIVNPFIYWGCPPASPPLTSCHSLICFKKNNVVLFKETVCGLGDMYCDIPLKVDNNVMINKPLTKVYPTLVNDYFNIETILKNIQVELYDIQGRKIKNFHKDNFNIVQRFDIGELENGIYFLKVYNQQKSEWHKIVVNK
jgi:hypothetical protein